jgi:hypothetical protein
MSNTSSSITDFARRAELQAMLAPVLFSTSALVARRLESSPTNTMRAMDIPQKKFPI